MRLWGNAFKNELKGEMSLIEQLYEDASMVVCVKKPGILSQPDALGTADMLSLLESQLGQKLFVVHRLDRNVGGVMVYARTKQSAARLSQFLQNKNTFRKDYLAICEGKALQEGALHDFLYKNAQEGKAYCVGKMRKGVKEALLEYRRIALSEEQDKAYSLLAVRLHTGRFHQIRVQFASRGLPLVGDGKYGSRDNRCQVALWAAHLAFSHPVTGNELHFISRPPTQYPWDVFHQSIEGLKTHEFFEVID